MSNAAAVESGTWMTEAPASKQALAVLEFLKTQSELQNTIARSKAKRPVGFVEVKNIAPHPNYVFDPALFADDPESRTIGGKLIIPPGPNNPVGLAWIGLNLPGYGLHGTPRPEDIENNQ